MLVYKTARKGVSGEQGPFSSAERPQERGSELRGKCWPGAGAGGGSWLGRRLAWDEEANQRLLRHRPVLPVPDTNTPNAPERTTCPGPMERNRLLLRKYQPHKRKDCPVGGCNPSVSGTHTPSTEQTLNGYLQNEALNGREVTEATADSLGPPWKGA